jgi:serine/threonine protein kinase
MSFVKELPKTSRGRLFKMYRTVEEGDCRIVRVYDATSFMSEQGIDGSVIRAIQMVVFSHPNLLRVENIELLSSCEDFRNILCRSASISLHTKVARENLREWIQKERKMAGKCEYLQLANDVLQGVAYLHRNGYRHNSINEGNILIFKKNQTLRAKVDFYDAFVFPGKSPDKDLRFLSPEQLTSSAFSTEKPNDMWGFGVLLCFIIFGRSPFTKSSKDESTRGNVLESVFKLTGNPDKAWVDTYGMKEKFFEKFYQEVCDRKNISQNILKTFPNCERGFTKDTHLLVVDFIGRCLQLDPFQRMTSEEALQHPLFEPFAVTPGRMLNHPKLLAPPREDKTKLEQFKKTREKLVVKILEHTPVVLMTTSLFDQTSPTFWGDVAGQPKNISIFFMACYMISLKVFSREEEVVLPSQSEDTLLLLFFERRILQVVEFKLFVPLILKLSTMDRIFETLPFKRLDISKIKI